MFFYAVNARCIRQEHPTVRDDATEELYVRTG